MKSSTQNLIARALRRTARCTQRAARTVEQDPEKLAQRAIQSGKNALRHTVGFSKYVLRGCKSVDTYYHRIHTQILLPSSVMVGFMVPVMCIIRLQEGNRLDSGAVFQVTLMGALGYLIGWTLCLFADVTCPLIIFGIGGYAVVRALEGADRVLFQKKRRAD